MIVAALGWASVGCNPVEWVDDDGTIKGDTADAGRDARVPIAVKTAFDQPGRVRITMFNPQPLGKPFEGEADATVAQLIDIATRDNGKLRATIFVPNANAQVHVYHQERYCGRMPAYVLNDATFTLLGDDCTETSGNAERDPLRRAWFETVEMDMDGQANERRGAAIDLEVKFTTPGGQEIAVATSQGGAMALPHERASVWVRARDKADDLWIPCVGVNDADHPAYEQLAVIAREESDVTFAVKAVNDTLAACAVRRGNGVVGQSLCHVPGLLAVEGDFVRNKVLHVSTATYLRDLVESGRIPLDAKPDANFSIDVWLSTDENATDDALREAADAFEEAEIDPASWCLDRSHHNLLMHPNGLRARPDDDDDEPWVHVDPELPLNVDVEYRAAAN